MRRKILRLMAAVAGGLALVSTAMPAHAATSDAAAPPFDVLERPALMSAKASGSAILALTRAGKRLVAVGERGIVLYSDDDAANWQQAQVPVGATLTAVQFVDDRKGWAVGHLGVVLHTSDGGAHWVRQLDGVQAAQLALQAAREAAARLPGGDADRRIAEAQQYVDDGPDKPFLDLYFLNDRTGYVVGAYNLAVRTDDGGHTWQPWMDHIDNPKGLHLYAIEPVGDELYIAGEQGLLLRSARDGQHFAALASPSKGTFFGLVGGRNGELVLYGLRGRAFRSVDGARSWKEVITGSKASLSAGIRLADGAILLASQAGEMVASRDGGDSFGPVPNGKGLPVTHLAESSTGRLVVSSLRGVYSLDIRSPAR